jgi:predicted transcriptional regulator
MEKDQDPENQKALEKFQKIKLDDYCSEILKVLWRSEGMRFNEIYRALTDSGTVLSKPTLSEHLKHLTKKRWLNRKVTGFQSVTYTLHSDILRNRNSASEGKLSSISEDLFRRFSNERSPELRAEIGVNFLFTRALEDFLLRFSVELETGNKISYKPSKFHDYEDTLLEDCSKDSELKRKLLEVLNRKISEFKEWHDTQLLDE